jgi:acyl-coenzyme A thioesterase PaaI-like protein
MDLHVEPRMAWTTLTLDRDFQGWDGIAHGGIIATILDEVMAWSLAATDDWGVTARMSIAFRAPVPIGVPLRAEGRLREQRRRVVETTGQLLSVGDGIVLATANGTYVAGDAARKEELRARYGLRSMSRDTPEPVAAAVGSRDGLASSPLDAAPGSRR